MRNRASIRSLSLMLLAVLLFLIVFPAHAEAHLNSTGLGPVYDGLLHFLLSPEDLLPVLALALLAGQRGADHGRRALFVLPTTWFAGGLIGLTAHTDGGAALTCISFLLLGVLLALDARLSLRATTTLAASIGLFHGFLNGAGVGRPANGSLVLLGLIFGIFVLVAIAAAFVVQLQRQWQRVAVRVVGSWIAACGLLMIGWAVRRT